VDERSMVNQIWVKEVAAMQHKINLVLDSIVDNFLCCSAPVF